MSDTRGMYKMYGFTVWGKNEYNNEWFAEAGFLYYMDEFKDYYDLDNFIVNNRIYTDEMSTLKTTRAYLKENADRLKNELIELLRKEIK